MGVDRISSVRPLVLTVSYQLSETRDAFARRPLWEEGLGISSV